jgi:hypothetical protein
MTGFASLDRKDRVLLWGIVGMAVLFAALIALFAQGEAEDTWFPDSYSPAPHGAKAAYLLLARMGFRVQRWEEPLSGVQAFDDGHTVLILADPLPIRAVEDEARTAVRAWVAKGGRVLATGPGGAALLPESDPVPARLMPLIRQTCEAEPVGFSPLSGGPVVFAAVYTTWKMSRALYQAAYTCKGQPVVVTYRYGAGTIVWWASASPLENGQVGQAPDVDLLLNSLGLHSGDRVLWDESLHERPPTPWSYSRSPALYVLLAQAGLLFVLLLLARARRSGPVRPLAQQPRTAALEFVRSLGDLYERAGASGIPVEMAYARFCRRMERLFCLGAGAERQGAGALADEVARRSGYGDTSFATDLRACEEARRAPHLRASEALRIVQALWRHASALDDLTPGATARHSSARTTQNES